MTLMGSAHLGLLARSPAAMLTCMSLCFRKGTIPIPSILFTGTQVFEKKPLRKKMMGGVPQPLRAMGAAAVVIFGGMLGLSLGSSVTVRAIRAAADAKRKIVALPCGVCRGKGFYICKLCKGNSTIQWSPLYDPVAINPCVCPTCDGNRVQKCLNCLGKGYN